MKGVRAWPGPTGGLVRIRLTMRRTRWWQPPVALLLAAGLVVGSVGMAWADQGGGSEHHESSGGEAAGGHESSKPEQEFSDIGGNWAAADIMSLALQGVLSGEGGGQFAPTQTVDRAEAAAMLVRVSGHENDAVQTNLEHEFGDASEIPTWAQAPVTQAVQAGLMTGEDGNFAPSAPLTRAQAAVLLVRAAGLSAEAAADANATLNFTDKSQIPSWAWGSVAAAVAHGFLQGFPDGSFRPNAPIERDQMAAILSRGQHDIAEHEHEGSATAGRHVVVGLVSAMTASSITVAQSGNGATVTIPTTATTLVYVDERSTTLAAIATGDVVRVVTDTSGNALLVAARSPEGEVAGVVQAYTAPTSTAAGSITLVRESGVVVTYPVPSDVTVRHGDHTLTLSQVQPGDRVEATVAGSPPAVTGLKVEQSESERQVLVGTVAAVGSGVLSVRDVTGATIQVPVGQDTDVSLDGHDASLGDLAVGDHVVVKLESGAAQKVTATSSGTGSSTGTSTVRLAGTVTGAAAGGFTLTVGTAAYTVDTSGATLERFGQTMTGVTVATGDGVTVTGTAAGSAITASLVDVTSLPVTVTGTVQSLDSHDGVAAIAVVTSGATTSYTVFATSATTVKTSGGATSSFAALTVGQTVDVTGNLVGDGVIAAAAITSH